MILRFLARTKQEYVSLDDKVRIAEQRFGAFLNREAWKSYEKSEAREEL
jgi:hypothetical protein